MPVGEPARITVGITAEQAAVIAVEIGIPDGFEVDRVAAAEWDVRQAPGRVELRDGEVPRFACGYIGLAGTATTEGVLVFPLTLHAADGTTVQLSERDPGHHLSGQLVYAGVPIATPDAGSSAPSLVRLAGWGLLAAAALGGLAVAARRVRRR